MAKNAQNGDRVRVHYTGSFEDGRVFDSSAGGDPLEVVIGAHEVIEGFEAALIGMAVGDRKVESIEPDRGYGTREDALIFSIPRSSLQADLEVNAGDVVHVTLPDGQSAPMQVLGSDSSSVTLDANHPLAGQTLVFELEMVSIG